MDIDSLLKELDELLSSGRSSDAEELLIGGLAEAAAVNDARASLTILNELAGVYRTEEHYAESMNVAEQALTLIRAMGLTGTAPHASALNNAAASYRAGGKVLEALECYDELERIYQEHLRPDDGRFASLYNDMALTCQELHQYEQAAAYFVKVEQLLKLFPDASEELAVTYTNMAMNAHLLGDSERTKQYLQQAENIYLEGRLMDPHYGALLTLRGQILYDNGSYQEAAQSYQHALTIIDACFGHNETWRSIASVCADAYRCAGNTESAEALWKEIH